MSNLGIGLGGFMQGFQQSRRMRLEDERQDLLAKRYEKADERQEKLDARQDVLNARADEAYERDETQRQAVADIGINAQKAFDSKVAAGTAQPGDFDTFWSKYALPKLKGTYLANGDIDKAQAVIKWGETADAKEGAKLAMGALLKAQTGDPDGALADVIKAGSLKGYIDHGYEVQGHDKIMTPDGQLAGYRLNMKTPDGKDVQQDVQLSDLPRLVATFLNPEAAWESQIAAQAKAKERSEELADFETKEQIKKKYGTGETRQREDAISALRKRFDGELDTVTGEAKKAFDSLPRDEQEKLIEQEMNLQSGQTGIGGAPAGSTGSATTGSGRKVVVDTATGQPARQSASPAGGGAAPVAKPSAPDPVALATAALQKGESPVRVAEALSAAGVPEDRWPEALRTAISSARQNAIGLGR